LNKKNEKSVPRIGLAKQGIVVPPVTPKCVQKIVDFPIYINTFKGVTLLTKQIEEQVCSTDYSHIETNDLLCFPSDYRPPVERAKNSKRKECEMAYDYALSKLETARNEADKTVDKSKKQATMSQVLDLVSYCYNN